MEENQITIPDGWHKIETINHLGKILNGLSGKKKEDFGEGEPFITYVNVFKNSRINDEEVDFVRIKKGEYQNKTIYGDLIFTTSSETIKEVGMTSVFLGRTKSFYLNSFCFIFRLNDFKVLLPEFVQYLFRSDSVRYNISLLGQGSTRYNLSKTRLLKELKLVVPKSTKEQQSISTILSKTDEAIAQTEALIAKYTRIKTGLMQDLLTKGIDENGNIRSEATHEFKDSPLGRIPKEWDVLPINKLCLIIVDCKNRTSPFVENSPYPVIRTSNIKNGCLVWEDMKYTDEASYKIWTERAIPMPDDIIITREAPLGQVLKIPKGFTPILGQRTMLYRTDLTKLLPDFLVYSILDNRMQKYLNSISGGSTVQHLKVGEMRDFLVAVPLNVLEQNTIINRLNEVEKNIEVFKAKTRKLKSIKTGLMQDLLSGRVRTNING